MNSFKVSFSSALLLLRMDRKNAVPVFTIIKVALQINKFDSSKQIKCADFKFKSFNNVNGCDHHP